jgi:hypothetical protein
MLAVIVMSAFVLSSYSGTSEPAIGNRPPPTKQAHVNLFVALRDGLSVSNGSFDEPLSGREELARYKALHVLAKYGTPLIFWKENAEQIPLMSEVARCVLCISASSAQSEREFSSVGRAITDARARLNPSKVEAIELVRWGCRSGIIDLRDS